MPAPDRDARYEVLDRRTPYSSGFTTIRVDRVRMPDGKVADREIAEHRSAVAAVPVTADDRVVLVRQYRHAFERSFLELPAGVLDVQGEDPAEAARRELAEEVALRAGALRHLTTFTNSAGWTTERTTVYLATDLVETDRPADFELEHEEADMEVVRIPVEEAIGMVESGEIVDAKTVVGLLALAVLRGGPPG